MYCRADFGGGRGGEAPGLKRWREGGKKMGDWLNGIVYKNDQVICIGRVLFLSDLQVFYLFFLSYYTGWNFKIILNNNGKNRHSILGEVLALSLLNVRFL